MSDEIEAAKQEIATIRVATPFGSPAYTPEVDRRIQALYREAYPEPPEEGEAAAGREFPEVLKSKPRRDVKQRETNRRRLVHDDDDDDNGGLGTFPRRGYVEAWGNHEPTSRDIAQWDRAVAVSAKIGVSPTQLGKLRDALLEDAPIDADGDDLVAADYLHPPPASMERDTDWAVYKAAAEIAARHGVSKAAFRELAGFVLGANDALSEPQLRRHQSAAIDVIVAEHGSGAVDAVRSAQRAVAHFGEPGLKALLDSPLASGVAVGDHPSLVRLLGNVGQAIAFDSLPREFKSATGVYASASEEPMRNQGGLKQKIAELEKAAPLGRRTPEEDREIQKLYEAVYAESEDAEDVSRSPLGSGWK